MRTMFPESVSVQDRLLPLMPRLDRQLDAGGALEVVDDGEEVAGVGVAAAAEHAHQALGWLIDGPAQGFETDGRVDIVAQDQSPGVDVAREHALNAHAQHCLKEHGVSLHAVLHGLLESTGQRHLRSDPRTMRQQGLRPSRSTYSRISIDQMVTNALPFGKSPRHGWRQRVAWRILAAEWGSASCCFDGSRAGWTGPALIPTVTDRNPL